MTEQKAKIKQSVIIALIVSLILTMTPVSPSVFAEDAAKKQDVHVKVSVEGGEEATITNFSDTSVTEDIVVDEEANVPYITSEIDKVLESNE